MDIREYFRKLRQAQSEIKDEFVVIASLDTPDGGKAGRFVEVTRDVAAHMIVDARGRLANESEAEEFRTEMTLLAAKHKALEAASKIDLSALVSQQQAFAIRQRLIDNPKLLSDNDAFIKLYQA